MKSVTTSSLRDIKTRQRIQLLFVLIFACSVRHDTGPAKEKTSGRIHQVIHVTNGSFHLKEGRDLE